MMIITYQTIKEWLVLNTQVEYAIMQQHITRGIRANTKAKKKTYMHGVSFPTASYAISKNSACKELRNFRTLNIFIVNN